MYRRCLGTKGLKYFKKKIQISIIQYAHFCDMGKHSLDELAACLTKAFQIFQFDETICCPSAFNNQKFNLGADTKYPYKGPKRLQITEPREIEGTAGSERKMLSGGSLALT